MERFFGHSRLRNLCVDTNAHRRVSGSQVPDAGSPAPKSVDRPGRALGNPRVDDPGMTRCDPDAWLYRRPLARKVLLMGRLLRAPLVLHDVTRT